MFKKRKMKENAVSEESVSVIQSQTASEDASASPAHRNLPPLPASDSLAAGVIAAVFAAVGMMMAVKVCQAANPKEKKPKKPKKAKKSAKSKQ